MAADLEDGMRVDGCAAVVALHAVALAEQDVPVFIEGHAQAGNLPVGAYLLDGLFDVGENLVPGQDGMPLGDVLRGLAPRGGGQQRQQRPEGE